MIWERRRKLAAGLRRNRERLILPGWCAAMREATGVELTGSDFLPLEETDALRSHFLEEVMRRQERPDAIWLGDPSRAAAELRALSEQVADLRCYLFSSIDRLIGAARLPAGVILANAMAVWEIVEWDLCLATDDLAAGLCLAYDDQLEVDGQLLRDAYSLISWGRLSLH